MRRIATSKKFSHCSASPCLPRYRLVDLTTEMCEGPKNKGSSCFRYLNRVRAVEEIQRSGSGAGRSRLIRMAWVDR